MLWRKIYDFRSLTLLCCRPRNLQPPTSDAAIAAVIILCVLCVLPDAISAKHPIQFEMLCRVGTRRRRRHRRVWFDGI